MTDPTPRIATSFARQGLMQTFGARLVSVHPGEVRIEAPLTPATTQQQGAGHAGLTFALGDTAAGYAALTLMPADVDVMTVELKINLMAPALGDRLEAVGTVVRSGRRITVVTAEVFAWTGDTRKSIALLQGTMIAVAPA